MMDDNAEFTAWLLQLSRAWRREVNADLADVGLSDATAWPLLMIARMGGGMRQNALAEVLGIEGPSLVRLLDQLCAAGFVRRQEDEGDRRAKTLHLTKSGAKMTARIEERLQRLRNGLLAGLPERDLKTCLRVFRQLGEQLGCAVPQKQAIGVEA